MKNAAGINTVGYDCVFLTLLGACNVDFFKSCITLSHQTKGYKFSFK